MLGGAIASGLSTAALALVTQLWQFYLLYGVISAVALIGIGNLVTGTAVSKWFVRRRGRALGISDLGTAVGIAILIPVVELLLSWYGWQGAWVALGILTTVVMAPASLLMRREPEYYGLVPDGFATKAANGQADGEEEPEPEWTRAQVLRTPTFWLLLLAFNAGGLGLMGVLAHQIPHITDSGFSDAQAALALSMWAVCSGISRLVFGFLAERIHARYLIAVVMVGSGAGVALLLWLPNLGVLYAFAVVYGLFRGAYVLMMTLVWADYYGRRFLGSIRGIATPLSLVSSAGGPILAGFLYDARGDYTLALQVFTACYILAGLLALMAPPPVHRAGPEGPPAAP
jgi:sugar phosphate permease